MAGFSTSKSRRVAVLAAAVAGLGLASFASAGSFTWTTATTGSWNTAANWTLASGTDTGTVGIPDTGEGATFGVAGSYSVTLASPITVGTVAVQGGSTPTFNFTGQTLSISGGTVQIGNTGGVGTATFNAGTIAHTNSSFWVGLNNAGSSFTISGSGTNFSNSGTGAQTVIGYRNGSTTGNALTLQNSASVSLAGNTIVGMADAASTNGYKNSLQITDSGTVANLNTLMVGRATNATGTANGNSVTIDNGADCNVSAQLIIGSRVAGNASFNTVSVGGTGTGTTLDVTGSSGITIGLNSTVAQGNVLNVYSGGTVNATAGDTMINSAVIKGVIAATYNQLNIAGGTFNATGRTVTSSDLLTMSAGGTLTAGTLNIKEDATITGSGTSITADTFKVNGTGTASGGLGVGDIRFDAGASLAANRIYIGNSTAAIAAESNLLLLKNGATGSVNGAVDIGYDGAVASDYNTIEVGSDPGNVAGATDPGAASSLTIGGALTVGNAGGAVNRLNVRYGGTVSATSADTTIVSASATGIWINYGTLDLGTRTLNQGRTFQMQYGSTLNAGALIAGVGSSTTFDNGIGSAYAGTLPAAAPATANISGALSSVQAVGMANGAIVNAGSVTLGSGGTLYVKSGAALTTGSLTVDSGAFFGDMSNVALRGFTSGTVTVGATTYNGTNQFSIGDDDYTDSTLAVYNLNGGSHSFANGVIVQAADGKLTGNGTVTTGVTNNGIVEVTSGTLQINGNVDGTGTSTVATGATLNANRFQQASLTVNGNANIAAGGTSTSILDALTIGAAGKLDVNDNDMIVHNGDATAITASVAAGRGDAYSPTWDQAGMVSSVAKDFYDNNYVDLVTVGVVLNSDFENQVFLPQLETFNGETVTSTDVFVKYTYMGDADLTGEVDGSDYQLIDTGYNFGLTPMWVTGDFNYDGAIDGSDYQLIDTAYGLQLFGALGATQSPAGVVPEPASLSLVALGAMGLLARRCRS